MSEIHQGVPPDTPLIPTIIDTRARQTPDQAFAITPRTADVEDGYTETSYAQVARGINKLSWWLDEHLGKAPEGSFETFSYLGPSDLRYSLILAAAIKTRRKVLTPSMQASFQAHLKLVEATDAKALVGTPEHIGLWEEIKQHKQDAQILTVPELNDLLDGPPVEHYPFDKTWGEAGTDPTLVSHTSGTTGLPKPVVITNAFAMGLERDRQRSERLGRPVNSWPSMAHRRSLALMPLEWITGIIWALYLPVYLSFVPALVPSGAPRPLTPAYVDRLHRELIDHDGGDDDSKEQEKEDGKKRPTIDSAFYIPDLLKQLAKTDAYLERMRGLDTVYFGGAALEPRSVGTRLTRVARVRVQSIMGATEIGPFPLMDTLDSEMQQEDGDEGGLWDCYGFDLEHWSGLRMVPFFESGGDGDGSGGSADGGKKQLFELVVQRLPGEEKFQAIFTRPAGMGTEMGGYFHTSDLFERVKVEQADGESVLLWRFVGRTDDFVKLASMARLNAAEIEAPLAAAHPRVRDVLVGGDGRAVPFALVQMEQGIGNEDEKEDVLDAIWPAFDEVNRRVLSRAVRLRRELVLLATPDKPFRRAGKGSVNRRATLADYEGEIRRMYDAFSAGSGDVGAGGQA